MIKSIFGIIFALGIGIYTIYKKNKYWLPTAIISFLCALMILTFIGE